MVLRAFACILQAATREGVDSVVRYGGEEFLMVLPGTTQAGAVALAERLRLTLAATEVGINGGAARLRTTASFGVATLDLSQPGSAAPLRQLIGAADELMYEAKRNGRDRVESRQLA
jgi:diguanylate cyclase (GGDEF)-like protein